MSKLITWIADPAHELNVENVTRNGENRKWRGSLDKQINPFRRLWNYLYTSCVFIYTPLNQKHFHPIPILSTLLNTRTVLTVKKVEDMPGDLSNDNLLVTYRQWTYSAHEKHANWEEDRNSNEVKCGVSEFVAIGLLHLTWLDSVAEYLLKITTFLDFPSSNLTVKSSAVSSFGLWKIWNMILGKNTIVLQSLFGISNSPLWIHRLS